MYHAILLIAPALLCLCCMIPQGGKTAPNRATIAALEDANQNLNDLVAGEDAVDSQELTPEVGFS